MSYQILYMILRNEVFDLAALHVGVPEYDMDL